MKKVLIPLFTIALLASCGGEDSNSISAKTGDAVSTAGADADLSPAERKKMEEDYKKESAERKRIQDSWTTLKFDKQVHDFGEVQAETDCFADITVSNTGDKPLIISNVSASCGCTMPKKPEAPIPPGGSDIIQVKFHSKPGQLNEVTKTVTVEANTEEGKHTFDIKAFVKE